MNPDEWDDYAWNEWVVPAFEKVDWNEIASGDIAPEEDD